MLSLISRFGQVIDFRVVIATTPSLRRELIRPLSTLYTQPEDNLNKATQLILNLPNNIYLHVFLIL
jgi:hypothetical protein